MFMSIPSIWEIPSEIDILLSVAFIKIRMKSVCVYVAVHHFKWGSISKTLWYVLMNCLCG